MPSRGYYPCFKLKLTVVFVVNYVYIIPITGSVLSRGHILGQFVNNKLQSSQGMLHTILTVINSITILRYNFAMNVNENISVHHCAFYYSFKHF